MLKLLDIEDDLSLFGMLKENHNILAVLENEKRVKEGCTVNVYRRLRGVHRFSLQYLWKRAVRITEKPYTPQRERLCMLCGNPVIFTDCWEIL